jgi:hypothetical protein
MIILPINSGKYGIKSVALEIENNVNKFMSFLNFVFASAIAGSSSETIGNSNFNAIKVDELISLA